MYLRPLRIPTRRITGSRNGALRALRVQTGSQLNKALRTNLDSPFQNLPIYSIRTYANGRSGRPHPPGGTHRMDMGGGEEKSALEQYGVDLTARAKAGKLDPVIGRDAEIHRTIQILSRRTKNNPVLIGNAGTVCIVSRPYSSQSRYLRESRHIFNPK